MIYLTIEIASLKFFNGLPTAAALHSKKVPQEITLSSQPLETMTTQVKVAGLTLADKEGSRQSTLRYLDA